MNVPGRTRDGEPEPSNVAPAPPVPTSVRRMTESDLTAVMAIEKAAFSSPWTLATFAGLLHRDSTRLWVAETGGRVVGYAAVWMVADQAELGDLAVEESARGLGIGRLLLRTVLREMPALGVRDLFLEVRVSNTVARRLYERHGFEEVGRRPGYYTRPREDALVLRARLPHGADAHR